MPRDALEAATKVPNQVEAIHGGQIQVQHHGGQTLAAGDLTSFDSIARHADGKAVKPPQSFGGRSGVRVFAGDQYGWLHSAPICPSS